MSPVSDGIERERYREEKGGSPLGHRMILWFGISFLIGTQLHIAIHKGWGKGRAAVLLW